MGKAGRRRNIVDQLAVVARTGGRKPQDCGRERVCNMPPLAATCRSRWGAGGSFVEAAGWMGQGRFVYFGALAKVHGRGHPRERVLVLAVRPDALKIGRPTPEPRRRLAVVIETGGQTRRRLREGWLRRIPTGKIIGRLTKPRRDIPIGISR